MDAPTPAEVREQSALVAKRYPDPGGDEALQLQIAIVGPVIADLTGRAVGGAPGDPVPDYLLPLARRAYALKIEQQPVDAKARERAIASNNLRSISAGPWSESYFGPGEAAQIKRLDPDATLAELLWTLATEAKRAYWRMVWDGTVAPAAGVQTWPWGRRTGRSPRRV